MKKKLPILFSLMLFTACPSPEKEDLPINWFFSPEIEEGSVLFITDSVTRETTFSINTVNTVISGGATFWTEVAPEGSPFSPEEVLLRKSSGHGGGGYGVYFAPRESGTDSFSSLAVFINILGEYCAGVIKDRSFVYVLPWAGCEFLTKGYGQNNRIRIEEGDGPGTYLIYINGNLVNQWEDPSEILHDGGGLGFLAVVTPLENFPSVPVTISFNVLE